MDAADSATRNLNVDADVSFIPLALCVLILPNERHTYHLAHLLSMCANHLFIPPLQSLLSLPLSPLP